MEYTFVTVCVTCICILTCIEAILPQPVQVSGEPQWHYPAQLRLKNDQKENTVASNVSTSPTHANMNASSTNITGICSTGHCGNVDNKPMLNSNNTGYSFISNRKFNPEALLRGSYVFLGLGAIVLVYFAWKSLRKRNPEPHRYGIIPNHEDMELAHLDSEDGDDDTTHFDLSAHRIK